VIQSGPELRMAVVTRFLHASRYPRFARKRCGSAAFLETLRRSAVAQ
jgi:hypothetical protein